MSAAVVEAESLDGTKDGAGPDRGTQLSPDDLRLRLGSPLFAREAGLAAAAPVPGLRELTWEHVINPTSTLPLVDDAPPGPDAVPRPMPIRIEDLLARPEPALAALPTRADAPTSSASSSTTGLQPFVHAVAPEVANHERPTFERAMPEPSFSDGHFVEEGLVKPIEEPPPVARDTDPAVDGLAALIVKSTPSVGVQRVEGLRDPMRPATLTVPVVKDPPFESPVLDAVVEFAQAQGSSPAAPSMMSPPLLRNTGMQPVVAPSPAQAELNRLAYVPDLEDDPVGPVEVPQIAYSDVRSAEPVAAPPATVGPTLSQNEMFMPRQVSIVHRHNYSDLVSQGAPAVRRRKRHIVRRFVTTLVLMGMVAGGLFAVKYFVLDRVKWANDVAPLANDVEKARSLHFDHDIPVVTLPVAEYAIKIVSSLGGVTAESMPVTQSQWRALGVVSGSLDRTVIGLAAMVDSPAFYDPTAPTIYVAEGLEPQLRTFAMHRALTMALLDQQYKWSSQLDQAAPAVVLGTRALFDADALAVALSLVQQSDRAAIQAQLLGMATSNKIPASTAPFGSVTIGRMGVALWPYLARLANDQRDTLEASGVMTDSHALDLRRLTGGATDTVGTTTQGMLFWYHVLAGRLDDDLAWKVALGWRGDDLTVDTASGTACVTANVQVTEPLAPAAIFAFTAWAAAAPPTSSTTVALSPVVNGVGQIVVHACDPGASVPTNDGTAQLTLGGAPLLTEQFSRLLGAQPRLTMGQAACAVYGLDRVTIEDERGIIDAAAEWGAPAKHPVPDPAAMNCLAAPASAAP